MESDVINQLLESIQQQKSEIFRLQSVIDKIPGSIYWKDKNGFYMGRNAFSIEKMQSNNLEQPCTQNAVVGKTDYDLFPKEVAEQYRQHDLEVMVQKKEISVEESVNLPNGQILTQLSTKRPLLDENNDVIGIVGHTIDITHLKLIETNLRLAKEKAEEANLIKTEFIRNMEHDIRTPLSGVLGIANLLWNNEQDEIKKECLGDITQCAKELLDYCNGILDFSKIETGLLTVTDKKFHLKKIIDSVTKMEYVAAKMKHLELKVEYDLSIPSVLIGDSYRINRILINLISNAIKFTKLGCVSLKVTLVRKVERSLLLRFIIEDTGIGIPDDKKEYIFERFSRLALSNQGVYRGIGMGLRIVKQFMYEIGGEIDVVSIVGEGTQFICTVPFKIPLTNDFV